MIEPTETESKRNLDAFVDAMLQHRRRSRAKISRSCSRRRPRAPVRRVDEVRAARQPILNYDRERFRELRREHHHATPAEQPEQPTY